jgi:hypothetical protein
MYATGHKTLVPHPVEPKTVSHQPERKPLSRDQIREMRVQARTMRREARIIRDQACVMRVQARAVQQRLRLRWR